MENEKKIFWIASYPKSGNTLFRAILASLFLTNDGIFNFKLLKFIRYFETINRLKFLEEENFEDFKRLDDYKVLSKYWLEMQKQKRLKLKESFSFLKTHSALLSVFGNDFTNQSASRGLIYLIRDPRDVVLSWSKHRDKDIDNTIKFMSNKDAYVFYNDLDKEEKIISKPKLLMSSWDKHVSSWQSLMVPNLIIRYEDLIEFKEDTIMEVINFFEKEYGFKFNNLKEKISNMIITTDFNFMKKQEINYGFDEARGHTNFFNIGKKEQWKNKLSKEQINKIEQMFEKEMKKFNYI